MNAVRVVNASHPRYKWEVTAPSQLLGRRVRKLFNNKTAANDYKVLLEAEVSRSRLAPLDRDIHLVAARYQAQLTAAQVDEALARAVVESNVQPRPLVELGEAFIDRHNAAVGRGAKAEDKQLVARVPRLIRDLGLTHVRDVTEASVEEYSSNRICAGAAPRTVRNYLAILSSMMRLAVDRGWAHSNPVTKVSPPKGRTPVSILTPSELAKLVPNSDPITLRWIMFGAFAGLRSSETERLTWEDIRLDERQLYVGEGKTKNAERWVDILPPLEAWLQTELQSSPSGKVLNGYTYKVLKRRREASYLEADQRVPRNALRHSFGSHHLVGYENPAKTATEMGHYSPQQTFAAYRRAVSKRQATAYWLLRA